MNTTNTRIRRPGPGFRLLGVLAATALVLGVTALPGSGAGSAAPQAEARAAAGTVLKFTYDGRKSVREGNTVRNMAGKGGGVIKVADGGRFKKVKGRPGRALRFPRSGYGLIEAPDRRAWDPRRRDFRFGTKVKIARTQVVRNSNVMQKGYYKQPGGQWKLQVDRGRPSCVVNGDEGRLLARSTESVANGRWHRLACRRTADALVLLVDGTAAASASGPTGLVSNSAPVRIGAKKLGPGRVDQFRGRMDVSFLSMG